MKLHQFLFDELHGHGVRHIFGIPGDFVLNLYNALHFTLIEVGLKQGDVSPILRGFVEAFKRREYIEALP